jgi:dTDP-4-dehydrorhamnose reductase
VIVQPHSVPTAVYAQDHRAAARAAFPAIAGRRVLLTVARIDPAKNHAWLVEQLPALLARLANHVSARFVHISSEQVFDGLRTQPYAAGDPPSPINLYGRQKLESERVVQTAAAEFAVTLRVLLLVAPKE